MKADELTERILKESGYYYTKLGGFKVKKTVNDRRVKKLNKFIDSLGQSSEWIIKNVIIKTRSNSMLPPTEHKNMPSLKIGSNGNVMLWAVIKPPPTEQEFLQHFLDDFICDPSGFERDLEAYDHVEDITKALKKRLFIITGEPSDKQTIKMGSE